nr:hypothetical protein C49G7.9 - Caenorhabditis elegans [Caenorhabditis elegans]
MPFCQKNFFFRKSSFSSLSQVLLHLFRYFFFLPHVKKYAEHDFQLRIKKTFMSRPSKANKCHILHTFSFSRIYFFNHNTVSFQVFLVFQKLTLGKFFKKKIIQKFSTGGSGFLRLLNIFSTKVLRNVFLIHSQNLFFFYTSVCVQDIALNCTSPFWEINNEYNPVIKFSKIRFPADISVINGFRTPFLKINFPSLHLPAGSLPHGRVQKRHFFEKMQQFAISERKFPEKYVFQKIYLKKCQTDRLMDEKPSKIANLHTKKKGGGGKCNFRFHTKEPTSIAIFEFHSKYLGSMSSNLSENKNTEVGQAF